LSSYPERCTLSIERRTIPGESAAAVESEVRRIVDAAAAEDSAANYTLIRGLDRPPFEVSPDAEVVRILHRHAAAHRGREPRIYGDTPWMDSALTSAAGIPTVVFGPGGGGAHALIEWSDLDQVRAAADILIAVISEYCG
jgi:acetylornithine deacetylase